MSETPTAESESNATRQATVPELKRKYDTKWQKHANRDVCRFFRIYRDRIRRFAEKEGLTHI